MERSWFLAYLSLTLLVSSGNAKAVTIAGETVVISKSTGLVQKSIQLQISPSHRSFNGSTGVFAAGVGFLPSDLPIYFQDWKVVSSAGTLAAKALVSARATYVCECTDYESDPYEYSEYDVGFGGKLGFNDGKNASVFDLPVVDRPEIVSQSFNGSGLGFARLENASAPQTYIVSPNALGNRFDVNLNFSALGSISSGPTDVDFTSARGKIDYRLNGSWTVQEQLPLISQDFFDKALYYLDGFKDGILKIGESESLADWIGKIGTQIEQTLSSVLSRIGGVLLSAETQALDPEVAQGAKVLYDAANDPDPLTRGLLISPDKRRELQRLEQEFKDEYGTPVNPIQQNGPQSHFDLNVKGGQAYFLDPFIATGFEYWTGASDPAFASFALSSFGTAISEFELAYWDGDVWVELGKVMGLKEYIFDNPVRAFRITGIDPALGFGPGDHRWVTMVSFKNDGHFTGTITALSTSSPSVPEPSSWAMMLAGFGILGGAFRYRKRRVSASFA